MRRAGRSLERQSGGCNNGVVVVLGTGVGGGIFLNGQLYKGSSFCFR